MADRSASVRRLLRTARKTLGEHLVAFLLSGWGNDEIVRHRSLLIRHNADGCEREFRVRIASGDDEGLPRKDHPMVLLALLKLWLVKGVTPLGQLAYSYEEIFEALGWADSEGTRATVDEAVLRYFHLRYESESEPNEAHDEPELATIWMCRLVTGYVFGEEEVEEDHIPTRYYYREVRFHVDLLKELRDRSLFDIDWNHAHSVELL